MNKENFERFTMLWKAEMFTKARNNPELYRMKEFDENIMETRFKKMIASIETMGIDSVMFSDTIKTVCNKLKINPNERSLKRFLYGE
jgi:hypothetical protein